MLLVGVTSVISIIALASIQLAKRKFMVAPEVEADVNPRLRFIHQNRFNPSLFRNSTSVPVLGVCLLFRILITLVIYTCDDQRFILTELLSPIGVKINLLAFYSLATMVYPIAIYLTHGEARKHLFSFSNQDGSLGQIQIVPPAVEGM